MDVIEMRDVSKRFSSKTVLEPFTFSVNQGEIFGLLGPSGSGKTTLIKMMIGILKPSTGTVAVCGTPMPNLNMFHRIGYMGQSDALYEDLTAKENLSFFSGLFGMKGKRKRERMDQVLHLVDLTEHAEKKVSAFSGGMKRRLSLAITLVHEPDVFALDEPTVGIDPVLRRSIWGELGRLKENGAAILVTTHVMDEAEKCDRLGLIRDGRMIDSGSPKELMNKYKAASIEDVFLLSGGSAT
ncbi:ABC transporter ATP-binding protein [Bacillus inaquosorum]|uniref:ABC transporter ATP-binding protein n=1 Tax=Bacillus inaquosorum TaxID=483913 RepID=UPI00227FE4B3|nr:ABC transporter ATP-binding protein [Bacillus inaquosorum]MCY7976350.1 ABC transporter ATP-binding protein [Bacillus inaquosorum]MCY8138066.1 ABC transporter ATP-binding protein [Bacillus inaquosorum]MCY8147968.1 ABC transporter ATP-binding protein [Bacillus inaquosorum]MCY8162396.1 ABC transporter ATP-binding protein [Bacillus inaquosorum]MCY8274763.1 ABC transporter ATP-binding protein [Bacillus inaquosorum]